jgi:hypothetical protein
VSTLQYIRQKDGTFITKGECKTRYIYLRVFRNGVWKEGICPLQRTIIVGRMENEPSEFLPADIYELVGIESVMTDEAKEKLKAVQKQNKKDRGE